MPPSQPLSDRPECPKCAVNDARDNTLYRSGSGDTALGIAPTHKLERLLKTRIGFGCPTQSPTCADAITTLRPGRSACANRVSSKPSSVPGTLMSVNNRSMRWLSRKTDRASSASAASMTLNPCAFKFLDQHEARERLVFNQQDARTGSPCPPLSGSVHQSARMLIVALDASLPRTGGSAIGLSVVGSLKDP